MYFAPTKLIKTMDVDIDKDGQKESVEILQTDFRYPLVVRWRKEGREHWAVASHCLAYAEQENDFHLEEAKKALTGELKKFRKYNQDQDVPLQFRALANCHGFRVGPVPSTPGFRLLGEDGSMLTLLDSLNQTLDGKVRFEPDALYFVNAKSPSDVDFALQEQTFDRIKARQAWEFQTGSYENVTVAVIDTGVDYRHPDLQANIKIKTEGGRGVEGWDFHNGTSDPDDDHWHGTYCAGLVGAVGDNDIGIAGVNWRVSLLPVKAFSDRGVGTGSHAAEAIHFAVGKGANVILCAWGSTTQTPDVKNALQYARENNVLVVAAAGNSEVSLQDSHFPASFSGNGLDNVISVGATGEDNLPMPSESRPDLFAPGQGVYSTFPTRFRPYLPYHTTGGTSAAAAIVAGAAGLLIAELKEKGQAWKPSDLRRLLLESADPTAEGNGKAPGSPGILNLEKAITGLS